MKTKDKANFSLREFDNKFSINVNWTYGYKTTTAGKTKYEYLKFSTGFVLPSKEFWDEDFQRVTGKFNGKVHINNELDKLESRILLLYNDYIRSGFLPSPTQILEQLQSESPIQKINARTSIYDWINEYANDSRNEPNTIKGYFQYANKIKGFEEYIGKKIFFEEFDLKMYKAFINYIYSLKVRKKVGDKIIEMSRTENDMWRYKTSTKSFLREARKNKIKIAFEEFEDEITAERIQIDAVYFDDDKIKTLFEFDVNKAGRQGLYNTWLWLLISCMTGLRYSDWNKLLTPKIVEEKIKKKKVKVLVVRQQKTDTLVKIPVYEKLYSIFEKHSFKLPPPATEQKYNESVKELCKLVGFTDNELIRESPRGKGEGSKKHTNIPFYNLVTTHTGRRTLANRLYLSGTPPQIICLYTGHQDVKSLLNYLKVKPEELLRNYFEKFFTPIEEALNI
jgi:hypothetical protein